MPTPKPDPLSMTGKTEFDTPNTSYINVNRVRGPDYERYRHDVDSPKNLESEFDRAERGRSPTNFMPEEEQPASRKKKDKK